MAGSLYSASWYRVAGLRPRLRPHVRIHRQTFRGEVWHVVQDNQTGRYHRLSTPAYRIVSLMDGVRTVEAIWNDACDVVGADQATQDEIVRLLATLHTADLIIGGALPHMDELTARSQKQQSQEVWSRVRNPMALRLRIFDPDRLLTATLPLVRWIFTVWGFLAWLAFVLLGLGLAGIHWGQMSAAVLDQALTVQNVALMIVLYPLIKAVHELGHAYATKVWGGEVHELGVMMLMLMPVPYVDASASASFREKHRRIVVGAAGIMVELALAAIATVIWVMAEAGLVRALALNVALIAGISTLVFNGNPLLRYDGYYVLVDLFEMPNLGQRANKYIFHLIQRHAFGIPDLETPLAAPGEAPWLAIYAVAAFLYRTAVLVGIALFVASQFFFIGVALAIANVAMAVVWPILKGIRFVLTDGKLEGRRKRAVWTTAGATVLAAILILGVPVPYATLAEGVVWVSDDEATVRVRTEGIVDALVVASPAEVGRDSVVARLSDPLLAARVAITERQLDELQVRLEAVNLSDRVQANILREQIRHSSGQLADLKRSLADLTVVAATAGTFLPVDPQDLPGRFQRRGDVIGYVIGPGGPVVLAVVHQNDIDLVRRRTGSVEVRLAGSDGRSLGASIVRETPAALTELPHGALATTGGGALVVDPAQPTKLRPLETVFQLELAVPDLPRDCRLGIRAHVRFAHPPEAIGVRIARSIRQVFLRQFNV